MQFHPLCDIIEAIYSMDASICEQLDRFHFVLRQNAGLTTRDALDTLLTTHFRLQLLSSRTFAYATRHEESHAIAQHIPILMQPLAHVVKRVRHPDQARQTSARALISMILSADSFLAARVDLFPCSGVVIYSMHPLLLSIVIEYINCWFRVQWICITAFSYLHFQSSIMFIASVLG